MLATVRVGLVTMFGDNQTTPYHKNVIIIFYHVIINFVQLPFCAGPPGYKTAHHFNHALFPACQIASNIAAVNASMARLSTFFIFIGLCRIISSESINYVKALNSEYVCPLEPCLILDDYLQESEMYFRSDSTFVFLPGIHHMEINLRLKNVSRISWIGIAKSVSQNISAINLVHLTKIVVIESSNITITDLIFISSGSQDQDRIFSATLFYLSQNISIFNVVFLGGGLSNSDIIRYATAVRCHSSRINISYSHFYNSSSLIGGGVLTYNCTIFEESNTYISNSARSGGATNHGSSTIIMTGTNRFIKNRADLGGGAISCQKCVLIVEGMNYFIQNSVSDGDGGALTEQ